MLFPITLLALAINPIIGFFVALYLKNELVTQKKFIRLLLIIALIILLGILFNLSTASTIIDWIILGIFHFICCFFIWFGLFQRNRIIKALFGLIIIVVFGIEYISCTIGLLGVGFVVAECEPNKTIRINNRTVYREYGIGNATSSWGGTKVCLYTNYYWFPFFEHKFFTKEYMDGYINGKLIDKNDRFITPKNSRVNNTPSFGGYNLNIKYDALKQEIILSDCDDYDTLRIGN